MSKWIDVGVEINWMELEQISFDWAGSYVISGLGEISYADP